MKKLIIGLSGMILSHTVLAEIPVDQTNAISTFAQFEGRYAKKCGKKNAHKLSYVIGEQTMARLIDAQAQYATFTESDSEQNLSKDHNKLSRVYGDYKVDLFYKEGKNFAQVDYLGVDKKEPHTKAILKQCNNSNPMS
ncbi:hypothetical protein [Acinetobacter lanii]|uniref:Uncharacterized protein n=1 Tax=Acinetobacter lanii TaxID=2715163 RepID=A0A6G8S5K4_9GAMM|nr:hypothetical protein [Acinetobacter lanii]QIO09253.1 hypothetical protein G8D99_09635 [Acinetobacter lanii]